MVRSPVPLLSASLMAVACASATPPVDRQATTQGPPIVIDEMLDAPVDKVWRAWTDPEAVTRWWALHANIRTEVGGPYELFWEPTHPWEYSTLGCTVTAVE